MRTSTKYQVRQHSNVCTNPACPHSLPHYAGTGTLAHRKCGTCGKPMRRIQGEPRGTQHPPR
jgi:hypothetical protein